MHKKSTIKPGTPSEQAVKIEANTEYLANHSDPQNGQYVFAYHITITNIGSTDVSLIDRHWYIQDGNGETNEVSGEGVVGERPLIHPGDSFQYSSGAILPTPIGSMHGYYGMVIPTTNTHFRATIPQFELVYTQEIH